MPATDKAHAYLRVTEQVLKEIRQRALETAEADAFLISNTRKAIERSCELLSEVRHVMGDHREPRKDDAE